MFNIVWTGAVFDHLKYFVASQLDHCDARFRFITNACRPGQIEAMEHFANKFPGRVLDIVEASSDKMIGHGVALDRVLAECDDGEYFGLIDPDIRVSGPFLHDFLDRLTGACVAVTSGRGVWSDTDRIPAGHPGVNGEYFYSTDGFLFGSPHFAVYKRAAVVAVRDRWSIGFGSGGHHLPDETAARLRDEGHEYLAYDTGKLMNAFLQFDGHLVEHREHDALMHIGGMSHFLSPPKYVVDANGDEQPDWSEFAGMESRFEVARYTALVLRRLTAHEPTPDIPASLEPSMTDRLMVVRDALVDLIERYDEVAS